MQKQVDVVIVGAGPVGLMLAIELKLAGADVIVLERLPTPSVAVKANAVGPLGAEILQRRGMGTALLDAEDRHFATMGPVGVERRAQAHSSRGGNFAALPLRADTVSEPHRRMVWVDQQGVEAILADRAASLDIDVRRGCEVTGIEQDENGAMLQWTSPTGSTHGRGGWLIGCDGGRSSIRKMAGFAFPGTQGSLTMYSAILDLDHPERLPRGLTRVPDGAVMHGPRPRRLTMHDFSGPPADRKAAVTVEELESVLRRLSRADVRVTAVEQASRFTDSARLVDTYRQHRVLLAGDAAHIHSPLGGQGLSLGLVDAVNLGWKLGAVIRGDMAESLLDSYTLERRPVAEAVLSNTLAQVALSRPDPQSLALRQVFASLMTLEGVAAYLDGLVSGLATRYDLGSELDYVGRTIGDLQIGAGSAKTSLFAEMENGEGVLLDASSDAYISSLVVGIRGLRCIATDAGPSILVRPDGCIAWAGGVEETAGLLDAINLWFAYPLSSRRNSLEEF